MRRELIVDLSDFTIVPILCERYLFYGFFGDETPSFSIIDRLRSIDKKILRTITTSEIVSPKDSFDDLDIQIISALERDAFISIAQLSKNLTVSHNTVAQRFKRITEAGVFSSFFPIISNAALGLEWYAVFFDIDFSDEKKEREFLTHLLTHPYIVYYLKLIGNYNFKLTLWCKNTLHLNEIISELRERFSEYIDSYEALLIFEQHAFTNLITVYTQYQ